MCKPQRPGVRNGKKIFKVICAQRGVVVYLTITIYNYIIIKCRLTSNSPTANSKIAWLYDMAIFDMHLASKAASGQLLPSKTFPLKTYDHLCCLQLVMHTVFVSSYTIGENVLQQGHKEYIDGSSSTT